MNCKMCHYFKRKGTQINPTLGHCRRYPPTGVGNGTGFPVVKAEDWCGECTIEVPKENLPVMRLIRNE